MIVMALGLVVLLGFALAVEAAEVCTTDKKSEFRSRLADDGDYSTCLAILSNFKTCSGACEETFKSWKAVAPNCSTPGYDTELETQTKTLKKCQDANANTTAKYIPKVAPKGTVNCTWDETDGWKSKYDVLKDGCVSMLFTVSGKPTCDGNCLQFFEEGIDQAPMCLTLDFVNYTLREQMKYRLVKCLEVRSESLDGNAVLQSATGKWIRSESSAMQVRDNSDQDGANMSTTQTSSSISRRSSTSILAMASGVVLVALLLLL